MARSMWRGAIQFGLVTIPIKLYVATESRGGLSFHLLHKECLNRIQMRIHCPEHGEIRARKRCAALSTPRASTSSLATRISITSR
jgi:non-homologous end joining protein Ku